MVERGQSETFMKLFKSPRKGSTDILAPVETCAANFYVRFIKMASIYLIYP